jgi:hypothetical protein
MCNIMRIIKYVITTMNQIKKEIYKLPREGVFTYNLPTRKLNANFKFVKLLHELDDKYIYKCEV